MHNPWGLEIRTHIEATALGTAGCLLEIAEGLDEHFALLYGDVFLDFDLAGLIAEHEAVWESIIRDMVNLLYGMKKFMEAEPYYRELFEHRVARLPEWPARSGCPGHSRTA